MQHPPPINSAQSRRRTPHSGKQKRAALQQQRRNDADRAAAPAPSEERGLCDLCAHLLVVTGPRVLLRLRFRFAQQLAAAAAADQAAAARVQPPLTDAERAEKALQKRILALSAALTALAKMKSAAAVSTAWAVAVRDATALLDEPSSRQRLGASKELVNAAFVLVQGALQTGPLAGAKPHRFVKRLSDPTHAADLWHLLRAAREVEGWSEKQRLAVDEWVAALEKWRAESVSQAT